VAIERKKHPVANPYKEVLIRKTAATHAPDLSRMTMKKTSEK